MPTKRPTRSLGGKTQPTCDIDLLNVGNATGTDVVEPPPTR
jgi:hypothetical protein